MSDSHVKLPDSHRARPEGATRVADVPPGTPIELTLTLRGKPLPEWDDWPKSALSKAGLARRFGVSASALRQVKDCLEQMGLQVASPLQGGRSIHVAGNAAAITEVFRPRLALYRIDGQGVVRAREGDLSIPRALRGIVTGVHGLDQRQMARRPAGQTHATAERRAVRASRLRPLSPADLEARYAFPPGQGEGQTLFIVEFGIPIEGATNLAPGFLPSDIRTFCGRHGLKALKITLRAAGVKPLRPPHYASFLAAIPKRWRPQLRGLTSETMMDAEIISALCPKASISMYFARGDQKGWIDVLDEMTTTDVPPVTISISYAFAEQSSAWSRAAVEAIDERLKIAALRGITVCAAAGDDGTACRQAGMNCQVEFPASSAYVLSVGGTMLQHSDDQGNDEVVWWVSPGQRGPRGGGATGGGVSARWPRPPWQPNTVRSLNGRRFRGRIVPDVTALAGPPWYDLTVEGRTVSNGGTSASAPLWAALVARIDALLPKSRRQRFLVPRLYEMRDRGAAFRDIVSGHNASYPLPGKGYEAAKGFTAVGGLGAPDGQKLLARL